MNQAGSRGARRYRWASPLLAAFAIALVLVASVWSAGTSESGSAFTSDGEGASVLVEDARMSEFEVLRLLSGPGALQADPHHDPQRTLLVVMTPQRGYDGGEVEAVDAFLKQGGRVLVVDNFHQANSLSVPFGMTFERVRLVEGSDDGVKAVLNRQEFTLQLERPSALHLAPDLEYVGLAESSDRSYLDRDGDGLIDAGDPLGPFPLGVEVEVGTRGGLIVAFAAPSLFLPEGADEGDNRPFRQALLAHLLPDGGRVIVDESRLPSEDPWLFSSTVFVGAATDDPWRMILGALAVGLFILGLFMAVRGQWGPHRFSVDHFIRRAELLVRTRTATSGGESSKEMDAAASLRGADRNADRAGDGGGAGRWSTRGRAALLGGLVLAVLGLIVGNLEATYAAAFLLTAAALALWIRPGRIEAERRFASDRIHEEMVSRVDLVLRSTSSRLVEIRDDLPREFELVGGHNWFQTRLAAKKRTAFQYEVKGALRGPYDVGPLKIRTSDPFRLRNVETPVEDAEKLLVIPRHKPLSRIPFKSKIPVLTLGPHLVNRAGDGTEFHALRDYQSGDSIRIVNWKASARSKGLVVNQRVHESMATIVVFLDARAVTGAGPARKTPLNEGCRATLSIVTGALQARDKVRVFVYGDGVRELCPGRGTQKAYEMSKALAELEPKGSMSFRDAVEEVLPGMKTQSPAVLVSGLEDDPDVIGGIKLLRQRELLPFVLALEIGTEPEAVGEGPPEPDAKKLQAQRKQVMSEIRAAEVPVVPVVPGIPLNTLFQVGVA